MTPKEREVMKLALEALKNVEFVSGSTDWVDDCVAAAEAIKETLSSPNGEAQQSNEQEYQGSDAAKAAHMMDLYTALGVKWGEDPFTVIARMREQTLEQSNEQVEPVASCNGMPAYEGELSKTQRKQLMQDLDAPLTLNGVALYPLSKEPVGEVILYTGDGFPCAPFHQVKWRDGMMPPEGTKLYTHPPVPMAQPKEPEQRSVSEHLEPVAYQDTAEKCRLETVPANGTLLHTTPPQPQSEARGLSQSKPLTDEEYSALAEQYTGADGLDCVDFGRAVARHYGIKEKNT